MSQATTEGQPNAAEAATVQSPEALTGAGVATGLGDSYFAASEHQNGPRSPTRVAAGAKTPAEVLRRLSLVERDRPTTPERDPREVYPALELTGNVISAAICIPHSLRFQEGHWVRPVPSLSAVANPKQKFEPRRGFSAMFDAFAHLAGKHSPWDHTLVAWTGEIQPAEILPTPSGSRDSTFSSNGQRKGYDHCSTLRKSSLPFPMDPIEKRKSPRLPSGCVQLSSADRKQLEERLLQDSRGKIVPVWLYDSQDEGEAELTLTDQDRWRRYAEHTIYTTFHYKNMEPSDSFAERKKWADYVHMNQKFADKIMEIYRPGDVVWVHDYQLMLLPSILRQRQPDMRIGFYLHVPFPSSEYVGCLSRRKELLMGILGANMIGFQTYNYSRHFASSCTRILGFDAEPNGVEAHGAHIAVDIFPTGIDASKMERVAFGEQAIERKIHWIRQQYRNQKIIIGRDRLDSVRGVAQKLQAFETFLERYPEWRGKVVLIQVTSQTSIEEEKEDEGHTIANKVSELVSKINGTYGALDYTPVLHYSKYLAESEYFALLRAAAVGLITSVRDGMNTTSLEYVLCQKDGKGPLILSEFSGTAGSLHEAITINPWDFRDVAAAIKQALSMTPDEKARRHRSLYKHVTTSTVQEWCKAYLARLLVDLATVSPDGNTPLLDKRRLLARHRRARRRLFLFDYDGTLTPIVRDPQAAVPSDRILRTIKTLAQDRRNTVWVISGRDQAFLEQSMGHIPELGLSAEHGCFMRPPRWPDVSPASATTTQNNGSSGLAQAHDDEGDGWVNLTEALDMDWQREVLDAFQATTERTPGSFVERKRVAITWHYRRADPDFGRYMAATCQKQLEKDVAARYSVEVMPGKANLEVRPRLVNKGEIAARLVRGFGTKGPDLVVCAGDDFTDEDMFHALDESGLPEESVYTVTVSHSSKKTRARWCLLEPADVIATVALLNGSVTLEDIDATAPEKLGF